MSGQKIGRETPANEGTLLRAKLISGVSKTQKSVVMFRKLSGC
jgi:hypothetical protein